MHNDHAQKRYCSEYLFIEAAEQLPLKVKISGAKEQGHHVKPGESPLLQKRQSYLWLYGSTIHAIPSAIAWGPQSEMDPGS